MARRGQAAGSRRGTEARDSSREIHSACRQHKMEGVARKACRLVAGTASITFWSIAASSPELVQTHSCSPPTTPPLLRPSQRHQPVSGPGRLCQIDRQTRGPRFAIQLVRAAPAYRRRAAKNPRPPSVQSRTRNTLQGLQANHTCRFSASQPIRVVLKLFAKPISPGASSGR